ncbi:metal-dependent hydrolase [Saccharolobus islandicus]|uniref:Membrane-bound metal-dependent hydrolase n=2 Tax=Saccharolobus islandicus TaxID=43080 RepID=F0NGG7_SACI5|nr:metal-dependent hydrolase [Sulfolobus islandicus]ADX82006.1 membrane-bound metal-dependent hydrolase [Sulfolobus islandicus HVE10/4]ADX84765.1 membrane-bound metal-dependent hydrolase [Sulfolobus islandicus REY15A]WCM36652.1 metal-dependent hydrolase [Sulfolobus islandicus]
MNLHTHIVLALAFGLIFFHNDITLAVLVGIGAAIPDLDREYVFTKRKIFAKYQLHRALFHNIFFALAVVYFNFYLGLGIFLHMALDLLTSPTDRGVELFFPLGRLVKNYELDYDGNIRKSRGIMWYLEDPMRIINKTADPGLKEVVKMPWIRIYGPFKNSRLVDWMIFYSSFVFIQLYELNHLAEWWKIFLYTVFVKFTFIVIGIVLFYFTGELWRRRLQFQNLNNKLKYVILGVMALGLSLILFQGINLYSPMKPIINFNTLVLIIVSMLVGLFLAYIHVRLRFKKVTI